MASAFHLSLAGSYGGIVRNVVCYTRSIVAAGAVFCAAAISAAPVISQPPGDVTVSAGQNATFTVAATGTGTLSYQWQRSGFDIAGATTNTLVLPRVTRGEIGFYDVVVGDSSGVATSTSANLFVVPRSYPTSIAPDPSYDVPLETNVSAMVHAIAPLPDGGYIAAGRVSRVNGERRSMLFRVNADGSLNGTFVPADFVGTEVKTVAVQSDGKVLVGGSITRVGYYTQNGITRLNADGSIDLTFHAATNSSGFVSGIKVQSDGKIVVAQWPAPTLVRLNPDGSLDRVLGNTVGGTINAIAQQPDGAVIAVGSISVGSTNVAAVRVLSDGTLDSTFQGPSYSGALQTVALAPSGKIYVGGFPNYGSSSPAMLRLSVNGAIDATFTGNITGSVYALAVQADGHVLVGGSFSMVNNVAQTNLARLTADGGLDTFSTQNPFSQVKSIAMLTNGSVAIGGDTDSTGTLRQGVAVYSGTGNLQATPNFTVRGVGNVQTILPLPGGKFMVFGLVDYAGNTPTKDVIRLNADGTIDSSFGSDHVEQAGAYPLVNNAVALPDGRVGILGYFIVPAGVAPIRLVRANGSLDSGFNAAVSGLETGYTAAILPSGKIAVGGAGHSVPTGTPGGVVVFKLDGSVDSSFSGGALFNGSVLAITAQRDGRLLVAGSFSSFNGTATGPVVRLNPNGTLDTSFATVSGFTWAYGMTVAPSGKIYIAHNAGIARLNPDGTVDGSYKSAVNQVYAMTVQDDERVIVEKTNSGTSQSPSLVRLNSDGSIDPTFVAAGMTMATLGSSRLAVMRDDGQLLYAEGNGASTQLRATVAASAPVVATAPVAQTIAVGGTATLSVGVTSAIPVSYQWRLNGTAIAGATNATYTISNFQVAAVGGYSVVVTSDLGASTSGTASVTAPVDARGRIVNLSIRAAAGTGDNRLIVGVSLGGANTGGNKALLFRGVGPTLVKYGVGTASLDPQIELYDATGFKVDQNDDWTGVFDFPSVGAFPFEGAAPKDAAVYNPYATNGNTTMHVLAKPGAEGVVLGEVYDATPAGGFTTTTPRLVNGSARTNVGVGDNVLILGFGISGGTNVRVLIRAVGPTIGAAPYNVGGVLADPKLEIYDSANHKITENDNWGDSGATAAMNAAFSATGAFGLGGSSKDSALIVTLQPGTYSAVVRGVGDTTGVALVELYECP